MVKIRLSSTGEVEYVAFETIRIEYLNYSELKYIERQLWENIKTVSDAVELYESIPENDAEIGKYYCDRYNALTGGE